MKRSPPLKAALRSADQVLKRGDSPVKAISAFEGCSAECGATLKGEIRR